MPDRIKLESGDNSNNIQVAGDMHVGVTVTEALEISKLVVKQELAIHANDALKTAEERLDIIANKVVERINAERPDLFPKFKDPAIQIALNETYKKYIETGDDDLGEDLINMLMDRLEIEQRNTKQFIIDDARTILPKLSKSNLSFLALSVFSKISIPTNNHKEYIAMIQKLQEITKAITSINELDIMYLKQANCVMGVPMIHVSKNIAECLLENYDFYFSNGISNDNLNKLIQKHSISTAMMPYLLSLIEYRSNGNFSLRLSSKRRYNEVLQKINNSNIEAAIEELLSIQDKASIQDVENFHNSIDTNWEKVFKLWKRETVTTLSVMPVGLYIGSIYLGRVLELKIPQEIFYTY